MNEFPNGPWTLRLFAPCLLTLLLAQGACTPQSAEPVLAGPEWRLRQYGDSDAPQTLLPDTQATLQFSPDGRLSGNAGCNNINASYQLEGDQLQISQIGSTRMFCRDPQNLMDQEMQIIRALMSAESASMDGDRLRILYDQARRALVFQKAEP